MKYSIFQVDFYKIFSSGKDQGCFAALKIIIANFQVHIQPRFNIIIKISHSEEEDSRVEAQIAYRGRSLHSELIFQPLRSISI